jgi:Uma2 family endonuclease
VTTFDEIPVPPELADEVERRRAWGADRHDEVWDGEYRMAPPARGVHGIVQGEVYAVLRPLARRAGLTAIVEFGIGVPRNYRAPDVGVIGGELDQQWFPTAAVVVEVLSPRDTAWQKLGFYAEHEVDELVMVDPDARTVVWLARSDDTYAEVDRSVVLDVDVAEVVGQIEWP